VCILIMATQRLRSAEKGVGNDDQTRFYDKLETTIRHGSTTVGFRVGGVLGHVHGCMYVCMYVCMSTGASVHLDACIGNAHAWMCACGMGVIWNVSMHAWMRAYAMGVYGM
jgi:hypothetical protein